jgi:hypothetical protein
MRRDRARPPRVGLDPEDLRRVIYDDWTAGTMKRTAAPLNRDDLVTHDGRLYVVRGLDPAGVFEPRVYLEDAETGEQETILLDQLREGRRVLYDAESAASG